MLVTSGNATVVREVHKRNAEVPILVARGSTTLVNPEQPLNAEAPTLVTCGMFTLVKSEQPTKASFSMTVMAGSITMSPEQHAPPASAFVRQTNAVGWPVGSPDGIEMQHSSNASPATAVTPVSSSTGTEKNPVHW